MTFKVFPTSIAGVQNPFNQLKGPLAKLWANDDKTNLYYPQDIGNNPAHCHVVQIGIYEYTTDFGEAAKNALQAATDALNDPNFPEEQKQKIKEGKEALTQQDWETIKGAGIKGLEAGASVLQTLYSAKTYKTRPAGSSLANISLYMPDNLSVDYSASYSDVSLTKALGTGGFIASAVSEMGGISGIKNGKTVSNLLNQFMGTAAAKQLGVKVADKVLGGEAGAIAGQLAKQIVNPQLQLIYHGVGLREFQLNFVFTPKSSYEAEMTKQIIDTLVYYSSPDIGGLNTNDQQQYLVPPQIFSVKFLFTGKNGIEGALGSVFNKALTNVGLDFLTSQQNKLSTNADQNINNNLFIVEDCVLVDVNVDYAPNGWAAFDDGHPVQTSVTLRFREMNIMTKQRLRDKGRTGAAKYNIEKTLTP